MLARTDAIKALTSTFRRHRVVTLNDLFEVLQTTSRMSVFRRLREVHYLSSYSHAGRYYTLPDVCHFDAFGLWFFDEVGFSKYGNLKQTVVQLIVLSEAGQTHTELENRLKTRAHNALLDLFRAKQITRERIRGVFIYLSVDPQKAQDQLSQRAYFHALTTPINVPDWLAIEILVEVIRTNQWQVDHQAIGVGLRQRDISVTDTQVEQLLTQLGVKKTPD